LEYLQQLQDKVLAKNTALLGVTEDSQTAEFKYREVNSEEKEGQWPSKKAKEKQPEKYHGNARVKMRGVYILDRIA